MTTDKIGTVLFVDDERRVLTSMRAMFRRDFDVLLANSGAEALALLREHDIDVIVSDQRMPGLTGVEVLKQVKSLAPRAMRILLTGYADLKAIEASINEGEVFRYLTKPCAADQLREAIELAVEASRVETGAGAAPATPERAEPIDGAERESRNGQIELDSMVEVVSPEGAEPSFEAESDAFELFEVIPKGGTATPVPPRTVSRPVRSAPPPALPAQAGGSPRQGMNLLPDPTPTPSVTRPQVATGPGVAGPVRAPAQSRTHAASPVPVRSSGRAESSRRTQPAAPTPAPAAALARPVRTPAAARSRPPAVTGIRDVDLLVLTRDNDMVKLLDGAVEGRHRLHAAGDLERALALLEAHPIGVLITDLVVREDEIAELTAELKRHVPELVTIVVSERSDAQLLIHLINYGQIFRFLLKPLHPGQSRLSIESAVARHRELVLDPALARRHAVTAQPRSAGAGVMQQVMARVRRLRERFSTASGVA